MATILPGIESDESGRVSVDSIAGKLLFDLAVEAEDAVPHPVDVEHVLAALILAVHDHDLVVESVEDMTLSNPVLLAATRKFLPIVFERYGTGLGDVD